MRNKRKGNVRRTCCLLVILCFYCRMPAEAKEVYFEQSLIQGITEQSEWEGMLELGMLELSSLEEPNVEQAEEAVLPSVVSIQNGGYLGSGSIFEMNKESLLLVSARHVIMHDTEATVTFIDGVSVPGKVVGISTQYDVGFVEVTIADIPYFTRGKIRQVNIALEKEKQLDFGSDMFIIGSTDGVGANISSGTILNPQEYFPEFSSVMIHSYCAGKPGMSGGGTFDAYGNYIGMLTGGLEERSASLPLRIIWEEYQNL